MNAVLSVRKRGGWLFPENGMCYREPNSQKNLPEVTAAVKNAGGSLKKEPGTFSFPKTFAGILSFYPAVFPENPRKNPFLRESALSRENGLELGPDVIFRGVRDDDPGRNFGL
jgi:hypothetical protein